MNLAPSEALTFDPQTHTYRVNGETVPSVTQLASIFGTPPPEEGNDLELTIEAAADRGTALHAYLEHRLGGGDPDDFELPDVCRPYADAVELFLSEHRLTPMLVETPLWGEVQNVCFAGTPDLVGEFDGQLSVLDWKFVSQLQKTKVGAQLSGYWELCAANDVFPEALYCVQFLPDGTYRLYPAGMRADDFHLCLEVFRAARKKHPRGAIL